MLERITPIILTRNEEPNIGSRLKELSWAADIVVVDSFSDDSTLDIISVFPQARVFQHVFESHVSQWNFALQETGIKTEWVLALDADYQLTEAFIQELKALTPLEEVVGYQTRFGYCINGRRIRSGVYPPQVVLYRRELGTYVQDGHTQRLVIDGRIEQLKTRLLHDDRKSIRSFIEAQQRYASLESKKIRSADPKDLSLPDRIRQLRIAAPAAVFMYCWIIRGGILDGWAGLYYACQRMFAELLLSLYLLDGDVRNGFSGPRRSASGAGRQPDAASVPADKQPDPVA
jgi:glycosyltransferase involved in cell wall biosynthesis